MEISLEIVPRDYQLLEETASFVRNNIPQISTINIPDLLRFDIRAWDACISLNKSGLNTIAHIRAIDFDLNKPFPLTQFFKDNNVTQILVIQGDLPEDKTIKIYPTQTIEFIKKLKAEMPEIIIYGAFDPYRNNIKFELDYLKLKIEAGADGFMSQPFFDSRLLEIYSEYLEGQKVFWGISPVTSIKSQNYWETRNRAIFPKSFTPTLDWNINFGKHVLEYCDKHNFDLYLMPIKVDIEEYLTKLFK